MGIRTTQRQSTQLLVATGPWAYFEPTADVSAASAKLSPIVIPQLGSGWWPLWQLAYYFSAGTTKTADLTMHTRDSDTGEWHAQALVEMIHSDSVTTTKGQIFQFEAPARHDRVAMQIALGTADDRSHIILRGATYTDVPMEVSG